MIYKYDSETGNAGKKSTARSTLDVWGEGNQSRLGKKKIMLGTLYGLKRKEERNTHKRRYCNSNLAMVRLTRKEGTKKETRVVCKINGGSTPI